MADNRLDQHVRDTRLRKIVEDLRLQQQDQAQEEGRTTETLASDEHHYAELPRHSHTGIR
ncbi:hypothetical protein ACFWGI_06425 [Streptomyces niveus]|uniref:hypothetical protein n=1 Tax=Streptomyces niveus TaxID=193462 RepID=UPI00365DCF5C